MNELVDRLVPIPGMVAIILFGSVARKEADEYSDIDILILFKDKESLWKGWDAVFKKTGSMKFNVHAIPETIDEFSRANSVFVEQLKKDGKVLYAKWPFDLLSGSAFERQAFSIVSYDLSALSYKEKMRVVYHLYESGGKGGVVGRSGGMRLGAGCVLVPREEGFRLLDFVKSSRAKAFKIDVLLDGYKRERGRATLHED